ncbi:hypothetical protein GGS21DRAFT_533428 [Xylaria nigripes]|nr:hypothetical protein GGS21DRAFT_533428 [Xylaria nigripes]
MYRRLLLVACFVATARADGWDDFANNLATDLAPFLALFGEQVTMQFLSESTTMLDNFIFAMAPLGILTAVVSVIRVCGGASLRAFIGRAQEGGGIAEAELCSSTSRDVCELYHNGTIVRVFGRPKILEIVHDRNEDDLDESSKTPPKCGIYSFRDFIGTPLAEKAGWKEELGRNSLHAAQALQRKQAKASSQGRGQPSQSDIEAHPKSLQIVGGSDDRFAPNPNLSFNIGIRELPTYVINLAALAGFLVQAAVVVFGYFATYVWRWTKDDSLPLDWAFPLMFLGTVIQASGMFFCAFLIENSTKERVFRRTSAKEDRDGATMYVVQPGNQIVGDQTFDSFSFTDASRQLNKYTTSWKVQTNNGLQACLATGITLVGFILQFIGLRAMHSSVSVFQLGAIVLMSGVRAGLRTQRMAKEQNLLRDRPDEVQGHELDWLALQMAKDRPEEQVKGRKFWSVIGGPVKLQPTPDQRQGNANTRSRQKDNPDVKRRQLALRIFLYRSRLAELTNYPTHVKLKSSAAWDERLVQVRQQALQLKQAIDSSAGVLFSQGTLKSAWKDAKSIPWAIKVTEYDQFTKSEEASHINIFLHKENGSEQSTIWEVNQHYLEAVLGLWTWSIISNPNAERLDEFRLQVSEASTVPASRIMATGATEEDIKRAKRELAMWIADFPPTRSEKWSSKADPMHTGTLWWMAQMGVSTQVRDLIPTGDPQKRFRLHGWQNVPDNSPAEMFVLTATANSPISITCAHDIYQSFLYAVTEVLESVGGETNFFTGSRGYSLTNEVVARLVECFKESGLGSTQDAHSVIIPALRGRSKLPFSRNTIRSVHVAAEDSRKQGKFEEAEAILKWAWQSLLDIQDEGLLAGTILELGELYRYALSRIEVSLNDLGRKGIFWMEQETRNQSPSHQVAIIADRYVQVELMSRTDPQPQTAEKDVINAVTRDDRASALWLISHVKEVVDADADGRTILSWAAQKGWLEIVKAALEIGSVIDSRDKLARTPLSYAAGCGHVDIVEILMTKGALPLIEDSCSRTPLSYAAGGNRIRVMEILLHDRHGSVQTKDILGQSPLHWAAKNGHLQAIELLMRYGPKAAVDSTDQNGHSALLVALLNRHTAAAELLVTKGARLDIMTNGMMGWMWALSRAEWSCAAFLLRHLNLKLRENKVAVMTILAKDNFQNANDLSPQSIPPDATVYAVAADGAAITMETVRCVAAGQCKAIMKMYIRNLQLDVTGSFDPAKHIIPYYQESLVDLLLFQLGNGVKVTESVVQEAAGNRESGEAITKLLLDRRGDEIVITENVVLAAVANEKCGKAILQLLLDRRGDDVVLTENIVRTAVGNKESGKIILELLLERRGDGVVITEKVVEATAANEKAGWTIIQLLLNRRGKDVVISERAVQAAAENEDSGGAIMMQLLSRRAKEIAIKESVVQAAAENEKSGEQIMHLLLARKGEDVIITESVVRAAAGNQRSGRSIMELLLNVRGKEVVVTESVLRAAAGNEKSGTSILQLLLDSRGPEVVITESILQAAAGNGRSGKHIIQLLLDRKGEIVVT